MLNPFKVTRLELHDKDSLRAFASVLVADCVWLTGLRVIEGRNGLFVVMATRKTSKGEYQDIYFPSSKENRDLLSQTVLEAYEKAKATQAPKPSTPDLEF